MTDESKEPRDSAPLADEVEEIEVGRGANRRRFLIRTVKTGALAAPVIITLNRPRHALAASALGPSIVGYGAAGAAKPAP
jgi:hypothetical protein